MGVIENIEPENPIPDDLKEYLEPSYDERLFEEQFRYMFRFALTGTALLHTLSDMKSDRQRLLFITYCLRKFREHDASHWIAEVRRSIDKSDISNVFISDDDAGQERNRRTEDDVYAEAFASTYQHSVLEFPRLAQRLKDTLSDDLLILEFREDVEEREAGFWYPATGRREMKPTAPNSVSLKPATVGSYVFGFVHEGLFYWNKSLALLARCLLVLRDRRLITASSAYALATFANEHFKVRGEPVNHPSMSATISREVFIGYEAPEEYVEVLAKYISASMHSSPGC